jgi:hypothetical protein
MHHLYLPEAHTDADLVLAAVIAQVVDSGELYVTWTESAGQAPPAVGALVREPGSPWAEALGLLVRAVAEVWVSLTRRPGAPPAQPDALPPAQPPREHPAAGEAAA